MDFRRSVLRCQSGSGTANQGRHSRLASLLYLVSLAALTLTLSGILVGVTSDAAAAAEEPSRREIAGDGAWCWFGDPRAVYHEGSYKRTYVGWVDSAGNIKVGSYDHVSKARRTATIRSALQINDHAAPSILMQPDGRLLVFYSRHSGPEMYYRLSTRPEDISSWGSERTVGTNTVGTKGWCEPLDRKSVV